MHRGDLLGGHAPAPGAGLGQADLAPRADDALFFLASPLLAAVIAAVLGVFMLGAMSMMRRRSEREDERREPPLTPEGKPTSPTGRSSGEPVSGEG